MVNIQIKRTFCIDEDVSKHAPAIYNSIMQHASEMQGFLYTEADVC
jgi:hypothetical protein